MTKLPSFDRRLTAGLLIAYALSFALFHPRSATPPANDILLEDDVEPVSHQIGEFSVDKTLPISPPPTATPPALPPAWIPRKMPRRAPPAPVERPPISGVRLAADQDEYFHDQFVRVTLRCATTAQMDMLQAAAPHAVRVERDGYVVTTVGEMSEIRLAFDATQNLFTGVWPVPWNAPDGKYELRLQGAWPEGGPKPESLPFRIISRPFDPIPPGFAVLTLEGYRKLDNIPGPDGVRSIGGFPAWAKFIGADALFVQGGESSAFEEKRRAEFPWMTASFEKVRALGKECHRQGLRLGVYALCYMLGGPPEMMPEFYTYGWNFDKSGLRHGLQLQARRGISITDPRRPDDIVMLLKKYQAMEEVDWVGLDYIRPAFGSCELVDDFVAEMPNVRTPENFGQMTPEERMLWLCRGRYSAFDPEKKKEPRFVLSDQWFWYRAHRTADVVRKITQGLGGEKPVWAFTLSWNKGWEHGQDPNMMRDAGVDLDGIMLYEADEKMFRGLVSHWSHYTRRDQLNLMVGNQLDWYLHQKTLNPSGPESYVDRILRAARNFHTDKKPVRGLFIHDIHRLLVVNGKRKGPYSTEEWALAAGHAITEVRRMNGVLPYTIALDVSSATAPGEMLTGVVTYEAGASTVPVRIVLYSAPEVSLSQREIVLTAESPKAAFQATWNPSGASPVRGYRTFVALRAQRQELLGEHPFIQTRYIQGHASAAAPPEPPRQDQDVEVPSQEAENP